METKKEQIDDLVKPLPDPNKIVLTSTVMHRLPLEVRMGQLHGKLLEAYNEAPSFDNRPENDKWFFKFMVEDVKNLWELWAVANEVGGITVMFPEDY